MFCLRTRPHVSDGAFGAEAAQISPPRRAPTAPPPTCAPPPTEPSARWAISKAISEEKVWGAHFNGGSSGSRRTPSDHRATKYDHNIAAAGRFLPILGFSSP